MEARKLTVINIEDENPLDPEAFKGFLHVVSIRSEIGLQRTILKFREGRCRFAADMFAVDVNFKKMEMPKDLLWNVEAGVRPLGPLMMLPFLVAGECTAFVPYSNYWRDPAVTKNPYVLLVIATLRATTTGELQSLADAKAYLEEEAANRSLFEEGEQAVLDAVKQFRERLKQLVSSKKAFLIALEDTLGKLEDLDETCRKNRDLPGTLTDGSGYPLAIELCWPSGKIDRIELSSLVADLFLGIKPPGIEVLGVIAKELRTLEPHAVPMSVYDFAVECLKAAEGGIRHKKSALNIIKDKLPPGVDQWLVRRLVVEFAWVKAWKSHNNPGARLKAVRKYLGLELSNGKMDADASRKYVYLIAGAHGIVVDKGPWRCPLKGKYTASNTNDAYQLDRDEPAALTVLERVLCERFASDVLGWTASRTQRYYPAWMTRSDEKPGTDLAP